MNWSLIQKALNFAAYAHRTKARKGTEPPIPYIVHPVGVAMILQHHGFPDTVIAAGLLHDTMEDAGVTAEALEREFGKGIRDIVCACSEPDKSLPWRERKQHTIDVLRTAPESVRAVAAADKLDNLRSMRADFAVVGDKLWERFNQGLDEQHWYFRSVFEALTAQPAGGQLLSLISELGDTIEGAFACFYCRRFIVLDRKECEAAQNSSDRYYIAIDPETCTTQLVKLVNDTVVPTLQGHEDIFPLAMAFEDTQDFLPGGDWAAVPISGARSHDGLYRSYRIQWK